MKLVKNIMAAAVLAASANAAQAYYVQGGYLGDATIRSSGACAFKPVKFENASFGEVYEDEETYVGWGLVSAEGDLLALYAEEGATILTKYDNKTEKYTSTVFENYLSEPLVDFVANNAECNISAIYPDTNSKVVYTDLNKPDPDKSTVSINFNFDGFVVDVYEESPKGYTYTGGKFSGSVTFKGEQITIF